VTFFVADRPFVLYDNSSGDLEKWGEVIQSMVGLDLHGAFGFGFVDVAVHMPVAAAIVWGEDPTDGDFPLPEGDAGGFGDLSVIPKIRILDPAAKKFGLAVQVPVSLPTGQRSRYMGDGGVNVAVDILAELRLKRFRALVNVAPLHLRPKIEYGGFVRQVGMDWKAGVSVTPLATLDVRAEIWGSLAYQGEHSKATAEWALSVGLNPTEGVALQLGAGTGIVGVGAPQLRAFAAVHFTSPDKRDKDSDGLVDSKDTCPNEPEDPDGWQDADGCPDNDNDGDGIPDSSDACPDNAENLGVGNDADGCPDVDAAEAPPAGSASDDAAESSATSEQESDSVEAAEQGAVAGPEAEPEAASDDGAEAASEAAPEEDATKVSDDSQVVDDADAEGEE